MTTLPTCTACGCLYQARPPGSAYMGLTICRGCNGERPHGERPIPELRRKRARRAVAATAGRRRNVVSIDSRRGA